jgi:N-acetylglutamate synthase-like GNAT family acetyltransferase/predicted N-acyltransferase
LKKKLEIVSSVNLLNEKKWNLKFENTNPFLHTNFLKIFEKHNSVKSVSPVYITTKNGNVYGHLIKIDGNQIANYLTNNSRFRFNKIFLKKIKFQFFCFGNTYLTNIPSCDFENEGVSEEELNAIFSTLKKKYKVKLFLLPDYFLKSLSFNKETKTKLSPYFKIDPNIVMELNKRWNSFEDYKEDVSSKYKKRIRRVYKKSKDLEMKKIEKKDIKSIVPELQTLYNNVHNKSSFSGPALNIRCYEDLANYSIINFCVNGYYLKGDLIGFSSEFYFEKILYSYFIGLDYGYNIKYSLYNRILYDSISNGIEKKASKIVYGRTASEFKSTIGAVPIESKSAVFMDSKILRFIVYPIIKYLSPKKWEQRNPFKKKIEIINYSSKYDQSFYELNKSWIEEFWVLEDSDLKDLLKPQESIIDLGGEVFFALVNSLVVGTAAMIPFPNSKIELAKMTIQKEYRGKGLSKILLRKCIDYARDSKAKEIFLISNRRLFSARKLYDKFGFKEVDLDSNKYKRGNYKMVLRL